MAKTARSRGGDPSEVVFSREGAAQGGRISPFRSSTHARIYLARAPNRSTKPDAKPNDKRQT